MGSVLFKGWGLLLFVAPLAFYLAPHFDSHQAQTSVDGRKPIVVEVGRTHDQLTFKLEPNPAPGKDILWGLASLAQQRGRDYPVVALVDDNARISDLDQVPGIAGKVQFDNVRTFVVNRSTGKMTEIKFCPAVPISRVPPPVSACSSLE